MANPEHLAILKQGVASWNEWRKNNPEILPDLSLANITSADIEVADLGEIRLADEDRYKANRIRLDLRKVDFSRADLRGANLSFIDLSYGVFIEARLNGANLSRSDLRGADLQSAYLIEVDFSGAHLVGTDFTHAKLDCADLRLADLGGANLNFSKLIEANLSQADLVVTTLNMANLNNAILSDSKLIDADLYGANLQGTDLRGAKIIRTNLSRASLDRAIMSRTTLRDLDLSEVDGLDGVRHLGYSSIGIETIMRSKDGLSRKFLIQSGFDIEQIDKIIPPDTGDDLLKDETVIVEGSQKNKYYSCFISYCSKNNDFVEKLYQDLRANNLQSFKADRDMRAGAPITDSLIQSIRNNDKFLLILSKESIASRWVEAEINVALDEEGRRGQEMIIPIRIDDAVNETDKGWSYFFIRLQRHITDFSGWKDKAKYPKAFERLLRDLEATGG